MQALFGISLDNSNYNTETMAAALACGFEKYAKIVFFVADRLLTYNRVASFLHDHHLATSVQFDGSAGRELGERRKWLLKIQRRISHPKLQKWEIVGVDDIADARAFKIFRSVRILYAVDQEFRDDVDAEALKFVSRNGTREATVSLRELSKAYILEEIALNVRLRVIRRIYDEFYLGPTFPLFLKLYEGRYAKSPIELAGISSLRSERFRFKEWDRTAARWVGGGHLGDLQTVLKAVSSQNLSK